VPEDTPRLSVRDLTRTYPGGWGVHHVSLDVPPGQIVALGGPNGSGKSTFLRCVVGLARHQGEVSIDGRPVDAHGRAAIGYLPQAVAMPARVTIGEVLDLFAALRGTTRTSVPLPEGFVRPDETEVGVLSGGQRHRVALTIAMLGRPRLLLLDEPVASLDEEGRRVFWDVLTRVCHDDGASAVVTSPSPSDLIGMADRAVSLTDGSIADDVVLADPTGPDVLLQGCP